MVWAAAASGGGVSVTTGAGLAAFTVLVTVGSNTVSNVPLVLLLSSRLAGLSGTESVLSWVVLAWVSTVAVGLQFFWFTHNLPLTHSPLFSLSL